MENEIDVVSEPESKIYGPHIFIGCIPLPEQCLIPNYCDYPDDKRIIKLEEMLNDKCARIHIIGSKDEEITQLYREMVLHSEKIDEEYLQKDENISITLFKKFFWFRDKSSCEIFEDVYSHEKNELIIRYYERTLESIAGNNLCISLYDSRGIIDRLPFDMQSVANKGTKEWREFR